MSLYLKKFETTSQYEQYVGGPDLILPNVSLCDDTNAVHYNPYDPYNGHEYVEIVGLKWATMNVGATAVTDNGLYFQWGDTQGYTADQVGNGEGKKYFYWDDYKFWTSDTTEEGDAYASGIITKYNSKDSKTVLDLEDDAAHVNMGGEWRMPTTAETTALYQAVNTAWTTDYQSTGVHGVILTAKDGSGAQLFLPAAGGCSQGSVSSVGSYGYYWSSSLYDVGNAYQLNFYSGSVSPAGYYFRCYGYSVRGVAA